VQQSNLIMKVTPMYPPDAKQARIQGTVTMTATINRDGSIQRLDLISGHPLLADAALDAVKQWIYKPTLLNGNPVEVITQIDVNFTLTQ
jgi:protein TonB